MDSADRKKPASGKRRKKDSHCKQARARAAADRFVEALTLDRGGRGAITRAAQVAYPNQKWRNATKTGSRLLKDPYVQEQIKARQESVQKLAGINRQTIVGNLVAIIFGSFDDVITSDGKIDWELAKARGIAHLIQEVEVTERHGKTGSRVTTRYKIPNKLQAHFPAQWDPKLGIHVT